jgi:hypothetical protein
MLMQEYWNSHMSISADLINAADNDLDFLQKITTGDRTWCFLYDNESKQQSTTLKLSLLLTAIKLQQDCYKREGEIFSTDIDKGLVKELSLQVCSRYASGFMDYIPRGHLWHLPDMLAEVCSFKGFLVPATGIEIWFLSWYFLKLSYITISSANNLPCITSFTVEPNTAL